MIDKNFEVIIVGGSYAGLAAAMALGRAMRSVLMIDSGNPCNRQTPFSHNFLTNDGKAPREIAALARQQVEQYPTVVFYHGMAVGGCKVGSNYEISVASGEVFTAKKVIFATGIKDVMPAMDGFAACWGISVLHCPYCHGYEVRNEKTGIVGNGAYGFEFATLISNWTTDLTLFTNGKSMLTPDQVLLLEGHDIKIVETEIEKLEHVKGYLQTVVFKDGSRTAMTALYARSAFEQHCAIPAALGCTLTEEGYLKVDQSQETNVSGVFACGDNTTRMRTVANAVAMGTAAGMMVNKALVQEAFLR